VAGGSLFKPRCYAAAFPFFFLHAAHRFFCAKLTAFFAAADIVRLRRRCFGTA
jgi:hypothetical protein